MKPLRKSDFSKSWVIWDIVTLAYEQGMTSQEIIARPRLRDDLSFQTGAEGTLTWITSVDSSRLWTDFLQKLDEYQRTHALGDPAVR